MVVRSPVSRPSHTAWMARRSSLPLRVLGKVETKCTRAEMVAQWIQTAEVVGVQYGSEGLWLV